MSLLLFFSVFTSLVTSPSPMTSDTIYRPLTLRFTYPAHTRLQNSCWLDISHSPKRHLKFTHPNLNSWSSLAGCFTPYLPLDRQVTAFSTCQLLRLKTWSYQWVSFLSYFTFNPSGSSVGCTFSYIQNHLIGYNLRLSSHYCSLTWITTYGPNRSLILPGKS